MLHRIASDEIWCWHRGGTITLHCISSDGTYTNVQLGSFEQQGVYATVVSAGSWFGARASDADVLVSAIVAPGFDFADFEMGNRQRLLAEYPQHTRLIEEFTQ